MNNFSKSVRSLANVYGRGYLIFKTTIKHPFLLCHSHVNFAGSKLPNFACTIARTLLPVELLVEMFETGLLQLALLL